MSAASTDSALYSAPKTAERGRGPALASLSATAACYVILYGWSNHWTSGRTDIGRGVFDWEHAIPFVEWTIVPYLSICVFFVLAFFVDADRRELRRFVVRLLLVLLVSLLCYAALPLQFTFVRPATHGVTGLLFDLLASVDQPYNRAPSLHIGVLAILWARLIPGLTGWRRLALQGWFVLIAVSVLTTYQHHVLDVPAGAALGAVVVIVTARERAGRWLRSASALWLRLLPAGDRFIAER